MSFAWVARRNTADRGKRSDKSTFGGADDPDPQWVDAELSRVCAKVTNGAHHVLRCLQHAGGRRRAARASPCASSSGARPPSPS
jgi:hypothetical protein